MGRQVSVLNLLGPGDRCGNRFQSDQFGMDTEAHRGEVGSGGC